MPTNITARRAIALCTAACAAACAVAASSAPAASAPAAPTRLADPVATGTQLLNRFMGGLVADDTARMSALLAPAWIIQRANGTWATRDQYLAAMPDVRQYQITDVTARYTAPALVVRSFVATQEVSAAGVTVTSRKAPRLSTFAWSGGRWRMTSHANFNPPD
jgi:Domain of unknown function (DUF4440)